MERCVGHCVCSLRSDSFSLDKCADCRVCTSAPFTTLCLSTYHLLWPSEQAGGQMGGMDGHCINKTTLNDMSYLAAASSTHCCGLKSSISIKVLLWPHPNCPLNIRFLHPTSLVITVSSTQFSIIMFSEKRLPLCLSSVSLMHKSVLVAWRTLYKWVIFISNASLRLIPRQFSRKCNKEQQQSRQNQLAKVWTMTPQVFICMELLATGCNMLAHV